MYIESGMLYIDWNGNTPAIVWNHPGKRNSGIMAPDVSSDITFFEYLRNNQNPSPSGEDGLQNVLVAIAAQQSYKENRPVKISEVDK